jgi:hypothetical protein
MGSISKNFSLLLVLILALSIIMAKAAFAQSPTLSPVPIPTPSVPQFTLQLVGPPYTVPTTYYLNQSSGQIVAQIGHTNEYSYVVLTIKNQPFPSTDSSGRSISLYYNVRIKNHNETDNWLELYETYNPMADEIGYPTQSDSDYTSLSIPLYNGQPEGVIPVGVQTDIQVDAMLGYITQGALPPGVPPIGGWPYVFYGQTSAWSNTQTVNVPANIPLSPTPAPSSSTQTQTPTSTLAPVSSASNTLLLLTITVALAVIAFLLAVIISLLLYMRKRYRLLESNLKGLTKANTNSMRAPKS